VIASRAFKTVEELRVLPTPIGAGTIRGYIVVEPQDKMNRGTLFGGESPIYKYFVQVRAPSIRTRVQVTGGPSPVSVAEATGFFTHTHTHSFPAAAAGKIAGFPNNYGTVLYRTRTRLNR